MGGEQISISILNATNIDIWTGFYYTANLSSKPDFMTQNFLRLTGFRTFGEKGFEPYKWQKINQFLPLKSNFVYSH